MSPIEIEVIRNALMAAAAEMDVTGGRRTPDPPPPARPGRSAPSETEATPHPLRPPPAEMDVTVWRTSRSTIVRELLDYSTAVFDSEGDNLAQSARIPRHLHSTPPQR